MKKLLMWTICLSALVFANDFETFFEKIETIQLDQGAELLGSIRNPIAVDSDGNILVISKLNKVLMFDKTGKFIRTIVANGRGPGEAELPVYIAYDSTEEIFLVEDHVLRRISLFDKYYNFLNSFYISSKHTQPHKVTINNNDLYCAAFEEIRVDGQAGHGNLMILYDKTGVYKHSFFPVDEGVAGTVLAYSVFVDFTIIEHQIFAVQPTSFKVWVLTLDGQTIKTFGIVPDYYKKPHEIPSLAILKNKSMSERTKIFQEYKNQLTPLQYIFNLDDYLFLITRIKDGELAQEQKYMMEIYNTKGEHFDGNIPYIGGL